MTSNVCHIWVKPGLVSHTCLLATKTYTIDHIWSDNGKGKNPIHQQC